MTLVLAALGTESIWLLTDRRLSYPRRYRDDSRKMMLVEAPDGIAILGYAGLGATARGTEPADWMAGVLGDRTLTVERALGLISAAMRRQLPRHLAMMPHPFQQHHVIAAALVGDEARLYTIGAARGPDRKTYHRFGKLISNWPSGAVTATRIALAGTGGSYLAKHEDAWQRTLIHLIAAHDRKTITARAVTDHLAALNNRVHRELTKKGDSTVGSRCIVAWRLRRGGIHRGGGGVQYYTCGIRERVSAALPHVCTNGGYRVDVLVEVLMAEALKSRPLRARGALRGGRFLAD
jgi:hypothetical protein